MTVTLIGGQSQGGNIAVSGQESALNDGIREKKCQTPFPCQRSTWRRRQPTSRGHGRAPSLPGSTSGGVRRIQQHRRIDRFRRHSRLRIPHSAFRICLGPGGTPRGKRPERQERLRSGDVWTPTGEIRPDTGKAAGSLCSTSATSLARQPPASFGHGGRRF